MDPLAQLMFSTCPLWTSDGLPLVQISLGGLVVEVPPEVARAIAEQLVAAADEAERRP